MRKLQLNIKGVMRTVRLHFLQHSQRPSINNVKEINYMIFFSEFEITYRTALDGEIHYRISSLR